MDKERRKKISKVLGIIVSLLFALLLVTYSIICCFGVSAEQAIDIGRTWTAQQTAGVIFMNRNVSLNAFPNAFYHSIPQISFLPTKYASFPYGSFVSNTSWESANGLFYINTYQYYAMTHNLTYQKDNNVITVYNINNNGTAQIFGMEYGNFYFFNEAFYNDIVTNKLYDELRVEIPNLSYDFNNEFTDIVSGGGYQKHAHLARQTGSMMYITHNGITISDGIDGVVQALEREVYNEITIALVGTEYRTTIRLTNDSIFSYDYHDSFDTNYQVPNAQFFDISKIENTLRDWACECLMIPLEEYLTRPILFYIDNIQYYQYLDISSEAFIGTDTSNCHIMTQTFNAYNDQLMAEINAFDNDPEIIEIPVPEEPEPDYIGNMDISSTVALTSWIGNAISGFFDTTIVAGMTIGGIFILVISFALVMWFLKIFAGG